MNMDGLHQGSCLCGTVKYRVAAPRSAITVIAGETLKTYHSSEGFARQFCGDCGSSLFWSDSKGAFSEWMSVAIATLDTPFLSEKQKHVCVDSKAPWYAIEDQWPRTG